MPDAFTAREVLRVARRQLGTTETGFNNDVKYARWFGMNFQPWCDMFVTWVLERAGNPDGYRSAYTPGGAAFWKARNRWVPPSDLSRGDVAYFDFPGDGVNRISHVGIVERVLTNGTLICIEGNTQSGSAGSQREGGGVYRRTRPLSYIVGGGRPSYERAALPLPLLTLGSSGRVVRELQKDLRLLGRMVEVTGEFDQATERAVRAFQRDQGLEVDGEVGKFTWGGLANALRVAGKPEETKKKAGTGHEDRDAEKKARDVDDRISRKKALRLLRAAEEEIDRLHEEMERELDELERELQGA